MVNNSTKLSIVVAVFVPESGAITFYGHIDAGNYVHSYLLYTLHFSKAVKTFGTHQ